MAIIKDALGDNQPPPLVDTNLYSSDRTLVEGVARYGASWATADLEAFGARMGSSEVLQWADQANRFQPELHTHDRFGHRIDEVSFHPAWHHLMALATEFGLHSLTWEKPREGAQVARAALVYVASEVEFGHMCPIAMTHAAVPPLRRQPDLSDDWEPRLLTRSYDSRFVPADQKSGVLIGMAMTERQGGSDVRTNTSRAEPISSEGRGGEYLISGEKWFCSAPMCDAFLVLAQAPRGLSCFLMPRWTPDGERNHFHIQRLKDKLGNRSNATGEVEFDRAWARLVGEEGRGVATIMKMVDFCRLDNVIGSAAMMRQAVTQAVHHTTHRRAFGRMLNEQPLMQNVLADLVIESEAAQHLMLRLAAAYEETEDSDGLARILTPVAKYWVCRRGPTVVAEALECIGGNAYVEESVLPRLYREIPLPSVWEGSGNVICLDVLRALDREPEIAEAFSEEAKEASGADRRLDQALDSLKHQLSRTEPVEAEARRLLEQMAVTLAASLLIRFSSEAVAEAFIASRLDERYSALGTLPAGTRHADIVGRAAVD